MEILDLLLLKKAKSYKLVEDTATGNPVAFNTNVAKPLNSLVVPLSYTQSGTGDPSPSNVRPISGVSSLSAWRTGVNIFDEELEEGMLNDSTGEDKPSSSNIRSKNYISVVPGKKYAVRYTSVASGTNLRIFYYKADKTYKGNNWSGSTGTYIAGSDVHYIRFYMDTAYSASGDRKISINYPYTETDYVPYDGTKLDVVFPALGKNLCPPPVKGIGVNGDDGRETTSATRATTDYIPVDFATNPNYRFSGMPIALTMWASGYNANGEFVGRTSSDKRGVYTISSNRFNQGSPTHTGDVAFVRLTFSAGSGTSIDDVDSASIQLEVGDTATAYEPYCNSVYGGSLDLVSGVLTLDWVYKLYTGASNEDWKTESISAGRNFYIATPSEWKRNTTSTTLACNLANSVGTLASGVAKISSSGNLNVCIGSIIDASTVEEFKTWLASNNMQIVVKLNNPITVQLTPAQVSAFVGNNTVWTNTTENISLTYLKKS